MTDKNIITTFMGKKVVVVTPAGRKQYMEILFKYILRLKPVITEYRLWVNTTNTEDIQFMKKFQEENRDFVTLEYLPANMPHDGSKTIHYFFKNCCDVNTVYVRFDDDIVCIDGIKEFSDFLKFLIENPQYFLVYANILNNAVISHIQQRHGTLDLNKGIAGYACMDPVGWNNGPFAEHIHEQIISKKFELSQFKMNNWLLYFFERVSINAVAWLGEELSKFGGKIHWDEEEYISVVKPRELNLANIIYGGFSCVHYAFYTQRPHIDKNPSILKAYLEASNNLEVNQSKDVKYNSS